MTQILIDAVSFGPVLRLARAHAGVSQADLAVKVGLSPARISRLEKTICSPRSDEIEAIAAELPMLARVLEDGGDSQ